MANRQTDTSHLICGILIFVLSLQTILWSGCVTTELGQTQATYGISGGVKDPGLKHWQEGVSLRRAIQVAGGFVPLASTRGIRILRNGQTLKVDLRDSDDVGPIVQPNDYIMIPLVPF
jgi:protein involved in polysaccharide export with SLBB domain